MPKPPPRAKGDKNHEPPRDACPASEPEPAKEAAETSAPAKPIAILAEREIPFEEERPPNFSPHFEIRVHRVRRREQPKEGER